MLSEPKHWHRLIDKQRILWLSLDKQGTHTNTLDTEVLAELDTVVREISDDKQLVGVVICSDKSNGFIAGADIQQFMQLHDITAVQQLLHNGQDVFARLAALPIPTVAMVHGFCMGGGLELALACRYRVAATHDSTRFSLPEVTLGIQPGWGGSVRLPRLIGAFRALPLLMSGKAIGAQAASRWGLVDMVVPQRQLRKAAVHFALQRRRQLTLRARWRRLTVRLQDLWPVRSVAAKIFHWQLCKKVQRAHYPAPYAILDNWESHGVYTEQAWVAEVDTVTQLFLHYTSKNLVNAFHLKNALKNLINHAPVTFQRVHVVGAGVMGAEIAAWCVAQGLWVTVQDQTQKQLAQAMQRARTVLGRIYRDAHQLQQALDRFVPDLHGDGIAAADIIIEAIVEDLAIKRRVFVALEAGAKADAILATNTSSIPLAEISQAMRDPSRLIGIHFFNPVARLPLIEIVSDTQTQAGVLQCALAFVKQINKLPLPVKSSPGFLINRILSPYLMESVILLDEGMSAGFIDKAATDFGMPIGPLELADRIGLDICLLVNENLTSHFGGEVPRHLQAMVKKGYLGRKTQRGFYRYVNGKLQPDLNQQDHGTSPLHEVTERLVLRLLNEVAASLREEVVSDSQLLDAGMIFGTGFAPFHGGPMRYAHSRGIPHIIQRLTELSAKHGERFMPDPYWHSLVEPAMSEPA